MLWFISKARQDEPKWYFLWNFDLLYDSDRISLFYLAIFFNTKTPQLIQGQKIHTTWPNWCHLIVQGIKQNGYWNQSFFSRPCLQSITDEMRVILNCRLIYMRNSSQDQDFLFIVYIHYLLLHHSHTFAQPIPKLRTFANSTLVLRFCYIVLRHEAFCLLSA